MKMYKHSNSSLRDSGFTLVELIGVLTVMAVLVGIAVLPMLGWIDQARMKAERDTLAILANEVRMSFRQENMSKNISALEGDMPLLMLNITEFDYWPADENTEFALENAWYGRLANLRGQKPDGGLLRNQQGDLREIAYNSYHRRRLMLVGPVENDQQRYIILSFMFPPGGPNIPAAPVLVDSEGHPLGVVRVTYDGNENPTPNPSAAYAQWFNEIYNFNWGDTADQAPMGLGWEDPLMRARWMRRSANNRSFLQRVVVQRIVQPRYNVTLNNNSPKITTVDTTTEPHTTKTTYPDRVYIYSNMVSWKAHDTASLASRVDGAESPTLIGPDRRTEHVQVFPYSVNNNTRTVGILEGRRVVICREKGTEAEAPNPIAAEAVLSVLLNENMTYTAQ